jgi:hypothetical protein
VRAGPGDLGGVREEPEASPPIALGTPNPATPGERMLVRRQSALAEQQLVALPAPESLVGFDA